jgi:hypothetical protein
MHAKRNRKKDRQNMQTKQHRQNSMGKAGQAKQTGKAGQAKQTGKAGQAKQTGKAGQAKQTVITGQYKSSARTGGAFFTHEHGWIEFNQKISAFYNQVSPVSYGENLRCGKNIFSLNIGADLFKISAHFFFGFCYDSKTHFQKIRGLLRRGRNLLGKQLELLLQKTIQNGGIIVGMRKSFGRGTAFLFLSHNYSNNLLPQVNG